MADVFISYQRQERDAVTIVAERLRALELDVWFDQKLRPGGSFDQEIADKLGTAKTVLVCWTPAAIASEWVRSEAAQAHSDDKLTACFLEPTSLISPFNLVHTVNLMAWAGQEDDEEWLALVARIGEFVGRPGLSSYYHVLRPEATVAELRSWAQTNGLDPLAERIWERVAAIEGESAAQRIVREKAEARTRDLKRAEASARSKALAKARGIRDPKEQARRMRALAAGLAVLAVLAGLAFWYSLDSASRLRRLDALDDSEEIRAFLKDNPWGPTHAEGLAKFEQIDAIDWNKAANAGSVRAFTTYIDQYSKSPAGKFVVAAARAREAAEEIAAAQEKLARLRIYDGPANGALDERTRLALTLAQYRLGVSVTGKIDTALQQRLDGAIADRVNTAPGDIPRGRVGRPSEDDFRRLAERLQVDGPTLLAIYRVETGPQGGFTRDGRPINRFHPHVFSRLTNHRFDTIAPRLSQPKLVQSGLPNTSGESWKMLEAAYKLDPEAAYGATAFGIYLIMGHNHDDVGFKTASELAQFLAESEASQIEAFVRLADNQTTKDGRKISDALRGKDWVTFANAYNGAGDTISYSSRLRDQYQRAVKEFGSVRAAPSSANATPLTREPTHVSQVKAPEDITLGTLGQTQSQLWLLFLSIGAALTSVTVFRRAIR